MDPPKSSEFFSLNVKDAAFSARQASVFGNLPVIKLASSNEETHILEPNDIQPEEENEDVILYKGEESIFKRPMPKLKRSSHPRRKQPYGNKKSIPDHKKNPHKWIKHSLASTSDVTDRSNTAAAFSFLKEIEDRKRKKEPAEEDEGAAGKIVFKKPRNKEDNSQATKIFRDRKVVMPAFEFGSKKPKSSKKIKQNSVQAKPKERSLHHLSEEIDDEDASG